jgi:hypothetical protein
MESSAEKEEPNKELPVPEKSVIKKIMEASPAPSTAAILYCSTCQCISFSSGLRPKLPGFNCPHTNIPIHGDLKKSTPTMPK